MYTTIRYKLSTLFCLRVEEGGDRKGQQIKDIPVYFFCIHFHTLLKYVTIIFVVYCR